MVLLTCQGSVASTEWCQLMGRELAKLQELTAVDSHAKPLLNTQFRWGTLCSLMSAWLQNHLFKVSEARDTLHLLTNFLTRQALGRGMRLWLNLNQPAG